MFEISLTRELQNVVNEIAEVSGYLWERNWAERNGGNFTVDVTNSMPNDVNTGLKFSHVALPITQPELAGRSYIVKVTGAPMRNVARQAKKHLLLINIASDLSGYSVLWGGDGPVSKPTSEFISHLKIHQYIRVHSLTYTTFLHTHPNHLIALTQIEEFLKDGAISDMLFKIHPEVKVFVPEGVGLAPYRCPGSEELADVTVAQLQKHRVILWEKHGCAAVGANITDAFDYIDIMEKAASVFFICKNAGYKPQGINNAQLAEIANKFAAK